MWWLVLLCIVLIVVGVYYSLSKEPFDIAPSTIHGVGVFTRSPVKKGTVLFPVITDGSYVVTRLGSKVNHSYKPNCVLRRRGNVWFLIANEDISSNEELTGDYNDTPPFLQKPRPEFS